MATFGNTADETASSASNADRIRISSATPSQTGPVVTGHAKLSVLSGADTKLAKFAIYADDGTGNAPGDLLAESDIVAVSTTASWHTFTFSSPITVTSGVKYWIGPAWAKPNVTSGLSVYRGSAPAADVPPPSVEGVITWPTLSDPFVLNQPLSGPVAAYVTYNTSTTYTKTGGAAALGAGSGVKDVVHSIPKTGGAAALGGGSGAKALGTAVPAEVYNLARWHWTLPTEDPGPDTDAEQIDQPELATYFDEHFYVDEDGYLVAVAPVNGFTTSGSPGTRSEGREHEANYDNSAWDPNTTGPRQFTITTRADPTSITGGTLPRKEEIIYQIHGASGTPPIYFAAEWTSNGVPVDPPRIRMFVSGTGMANANVVSGITTDTPITIRVRVADAQLTAWVVDGEVGALPATPTFGPVDTADFNDQLNWYFKAGAYNKTEAGTGSSGQSIARISHWELLQPGDATIYPKTGGAAGAGAGSGAKVVTAPAVHAKTGGAAAIGAGSGGRQLVEPAVHVKTGGAAGLAAGSGAREITHSKTGGAAATGSGSGTRALVHSRTGGGAAAGAGSGARTLDLPRTGGAAAVGAGSGAQLLGHDYAKAGGAAANGAGGGARQLVRSYTGGAAALGAGSGTRTVTPATVHERTGGAAAIGAGIGSGSVGGAIEYSRAGGAAGLGAGGGVVEVAHPAEHIRTGGAAGLAAGAGTRERTHDRAGGAAGVAGGSGAAEVAPAAVHERAGGAAALGAGAGQLELDLHTVHQRSGGAAGLGAGAGTRAVTHPTVYARSGGGAGVGAGIALVEVIPAAVHVRTGGAAAVGAGSGRGRVGGRFHAGRPYRVGSWHAGEPIAAGRQHAGVPYAAGQHHAGPESVT